MGNRLSSTLLSLPASTILSLCTSLVVSAALCKRFGCKLPPSSPGSQSEVHLLSQVGDDVQRKELELGIECCKAFSSPFMQSIGNLSRGNRTTPPRTTALGIVVVLAGAPGARRGRTFVSVETSNPPWEHLF